MGRRGSRPYLVGRKCAGGGEQVGEGHAAEAEAELVQEMSAAEAGGGEGAGAELGGCGGRGRWAGTYGTYGTHGNYGTYGNQRSVTNSSRFIRVLTRTVVAATCWLGNEGSRGCSPVFRNL